MQAQQLRIDLLKLKRDVPLMSFYWVLIPLVCMLLAYMVVRACWTGWFLIPCMFFVASANLYIASNRRQRCLARIAAIRLDPLLWQRFDQLHPNVGLRERRLIEQGFKDYLGLHAMQRQTYAMPSHAVDALWHVLLEFPVQYEQLCRQTLGRILHHRPNDSSHRSNPLLSSHTAQQQSQQQLQAQSIQLCEAWRHSCKLNGLNPLTTTHLSRLFAIDAALSWPQGQCYDLEEIQQHYRRYLKNQNSSSDGGSGCSSCSSCGGD